MLSCDTLIRNANLVDGSAAEPEQADVAICGDRIGAIGLALNVTRWCGIEMDAKGRRRLRGVDIANQSIQIDIQLSDLTICAWRCDAITAARAGRPSNEMVPLVGSEDE